MSIRVHQPLVWYMTNKHAAGYVGLFKGPEMEALERRGSFSCPGVTPCQPRWQHSLAWVRSALSNMWWCTHVYAHTNTDTQRPRIYVQIHSLLLLCCHHVDKSWYICLCKQHWDSDGSYHTQVILGIYIGAQVDQMCNTIKRASFV